MSASPRAGKETPQEGHVVERQVTFPHPPEKVWRILTDRTKLPLWLHPATDNIEPTVGHRFAFVPNGSNAGDRIDCEVVSAQVGRRLAYTWQPANGEPVSIVTWTLQPMDGGGTRVHLRHDGALPGSAVPQLTAVLAGNAARAPRRFRRLTAGSYRTQGYYYADDSDGRRTNGPWRRARLRYLLPPASRPDRHDLRADR